MILEAGERIAYTVTWLAMASPPAPAPPDGGLALVEATDPPPAWFLYLYREVGQDWEWTDWLGRSPAEVAAFVGDPEVTITTLLVDGWPGGFFMLDTREPAVCDLAYFGLVPQAIGRGLGRRLLAAAVRRGWARPGVLRMTVNTNSLDHPRAMGLYRDAGFVAVRSTRASRVLSRPRAVPDGPESPDGAES